MKSDFVSTVSHELRTPLTSIYGFSQTLLRRDIGFSRRRARDVPRLHRLRVGAPHADRRRAAERRADRSRDARGRPRVDRRRAAPARGDLGPGAAGADQRPPVRGRGGRRPPAGAGRPGQAAPGRLPAGGERGQVLACGRLGPARGARPPARRRDHRRRRGPGHLGIPPRPDLRPLLPRRRDAARHGARAVHRAEPRRRHGRQALGRLGGGERLALQLRAAVRRPRRRASLGTSTGPEGAALEPLEPVDTLLRPR